MGIWDLKNLWLLLELYLEPTRWSRDFLIQVYRSSLSNVLVVSSSDIKTGSGPGVEYQITGL